MKKITDPVQYNLNGTWCAAWVIGLGNAEGTILHLKVEPLTSGSSKVYSVVQGTTPGTWRNPV